jgi:flagellar hook-associated protein 2
MSTLQNIEGIASGFDISSIVDTIIEYESRPVAILEQEKELKTAQVSTYQAVLAKFLALKTNISLLKRESQFNKIRFDISDESVISASSTGEMISGTYNVSVLELARNHQLASQGFDDVTGDIFGIGTISLAVGDDSLTTIDIESGSNTLIGIKDAINNAGVGVSASIINDGSTSKPYRLLITADETGAANDIQFEINLTGGETLDFNSGSFDNPEILQFADASTSGVSLGSTASFSGAENKIYTFTVAGTGTQTIGSDVITLNWTDGTNSDSIVINQADTDYEVLLGGMEYDGLKLSFSSGTLTAGDTFQVGTFAPLLQEAGDARIAVGGSTGSGSPIIVTSSKNIFKDAIPGMELSVLRKTNPGETITVKSEKDVPAIKELLANVIEKYNDVMDFINDQFTYNQDTSESGVLFADLSLQVMQRSIQFASTSFVTGLQGRFNSLSSIGIRSDADGHLKIADSSALTNAIENNFEEFVKLFINSGESTNSFIEYVSSTSQTASGESFNVNITQAATKGYFQGSSISDPSLGGLTLDATNNAVRLNINGRISEILRLSERTYNSGEDLANELQTRIDADENIGNFGLEVEWVDDGDSGHLRIVSGQYGSESSIQLMTSITESAYNAIGLAAGAYQDGQDVAGTINGESTTGSGQYLVGDEDNESTSGLKLKVTLTEEDLALNYSGTVMTVEGLASIIDGTLDNITKTIDGSIARRTSALNNQIRYLDERIADYNEKLERRREYLYSQYLAMEEALSEYQATGSYLEAQLKNLQSNFDQMFGNND